MTDDERDALADGIMAGLQRFVTRWCTVQSGLCPECGQACTVQQGEGWVLAVPCGHRLFVGELFPAVKRHMPHRREEAP